MNCPHCYYDDTKTIDSRPTSIAVVRRRECKRCKKRWTTKEFSEEELDKQMANGAIEALREAKNANNEVSEQLDTAIRRIGIAVSGSE